MNFFLRESSLNEIFRILSTNINKVRMLLIEKNFNLMIMKQFLHEFEYDLKLIYDILKENKYSFNYGNDNRQLENIDYLKLSERIKKHFHSNDSEEKGKKYNKSKSKNKKNRKYGLTINILTDTYFDSAKKNNKKFNKSNSCKSYRNKSLSNIIKNLKKNINKNKRDKVDIIIDKKLDYLTDYSFKKSYETVETYNKFRTNINKNKTSLKHLNSLYTYYNELLKKNNNQLTYNNNNYDYKNSVDSDRNDISNDNLSNHRNNSILLSEENKNQKDYKNDNHMNYDYIKDYERNTNYMKEKRNKLLKDGHSETLKKIIIQLLDDGNTLKELKKNFGNDIAQRLLEGELDNEEINNIFLHLKKYDINKNKREKDKNLFRCSNYYRNYKNDNNILLSRNYNYKNNFNNYYNSVYNNIPLSD